MSELADECADAITRTLLELLGEPSTAPRRASSVVRAKERAFRSSPLAVDLAIVEAPIVEVAPRRIPAKLPRLRRPRAPKVASAQPPPTPWDPRAHVIRRRREPDA